MLLPSRDHAKFEIGLSDFVNCTASPPSGRIAKIWLRSAMRGLVKAIHLPSGDQRGFEAGLSPRVSCVVRVVALSVSQMWVTNASCAKSVSVMVYATYAPSGEICAPPIDLSVSRSSMVGIRRSAAVSGRRQRTVVTVASTRAIWSSVERLSG